MFGYIDYMPVKRKPLGRFFKFKKKINNFMLHKGYMYKGVVVQTKSMAYIKYATTPEPHYKILKIPYTCKLSCPCHCPCHTIVKPPEGFNIRPF